MILSKFPRVAAGVLLTVYVMAMPASLLGKAVQAAADSDLKQAQDKFRAGDFDEALKLYAAAAEAARELGDKRKEMNALAGMGQSLSRQYESAKAYDAYRRALDIARSIPDREAEFNMLHAAGSAAAWTGDTAAALSFFSAALNVSRESDDREKIERILNAMGVARYQAGEFEAALDFYRQAVEIGRSMDGRGHEGFVLINMGEVYRRVREMEKAQRAYEEAVEFARRIQNGNLEWAGVRSLGAVAYDTGRMPEARRAYDRAFELCREMKNRDGLAGTHVAMGKVDLAERNLDAARSHFEAARAIYEESGSNLVMHPLNYLGDVHHLEGRPDQAIDYYRRSLGLAEKMDVFNYLIEMNYKIARALEAGGDARNALVHYVRSVEHIESIRGRVGGESFRAGFLKGYIEIYERLIGLLLRLHLRDPSSGFDRQAFAAAEKAKARAFLDSLEEARIDLFSTLDSRLQREKLRISRSITQTMAALQRPGLDEDARASLLSALSRSEEDYSLFMETVRRENPRLAEIQAVEPPDIDAVRKRLLDEKTALVEFFTGEEAVFAFLVTREGFWAEDLGGAGDLNRAVEDYLLFLRTASGEDVRLGSRRLAARLFPFARRILPGIDKLIIVPDGVLHHLPFETLAVDRDGTGPRLLLETCALSTAPSAASLIALKARPLRAETVFDLAGFGSPRYTETSEAKERSAARDSLRESFLERGFELPPLPFSAREIRNAARFFKSARTRIFLGADASETELKKARLSEFRILHLAVHGLVDEKSAARSALVFSGGSGPDEDGFLMVREIYELDLPVELVVLSACSTARGKLEKGEGISGLSRAFLYAGARAVVASLWSVRDRSTSEFMPRFYRHMTEGHALEEALRRAKLDSLRAGVPPAGWAAFILIGEGRESPGKR